jgi:L-threonylcarbamoyladenylate synthase
VPDQNCVNSPGLLHPHYQPAARVVLINKLQELSAEDLSSAAYCGTSQSDVTADFALASVYESQEEFAANFYEFLREVDRQSISTVFVESAKPVGIGKALLDRQRRAAQK